MTPSPLAPPARSWTAADIPDLTGRTAVVTGANSGLGLVVSRALAENGARVVLAVRDPDRGHAASAALPGDTEVRALDLADLDSVRAFAAGLTADTDRLDLLVNNAGVGFAGAPRTAQGFEGTLGVNHLGHFALTGLLLPLLDEGADPRVLTVTSDIARTGRLDPDTLDDPADAPSPVAAYARSKLANVLFGRELDRRLRATGSRVHSVLAHPGMSRTPIHGRIGSAPARLLFAALSRILGRPADQGALPLLHAATGPRPRPDTIVGPGGPLIAALSPARPTPEPLRGAGANDDLARRLWAASERLTGVHYPLRSDVDRP